MITRNDVSKMSDRQWCLYLCKRYGEVLAPEIFAMFEPRDGTAPVGFATYAALRHAPTAEAYHAQRAARLAA